MHKKIFFFILVVVVGNRVYSQPDIDTNLATPFPLYVDSMSTKTIDTIGNTLLIQYYHPTKKYNGRRMFLGKDRYLLSGELIESSRIDYDNEITIGYSFFESGEINSISICHFLEGGCDYIMSFFENGTIKSIFSVNSEGFNSGYLYEFSPDGRLIQNEFYGEDSMPVDGVSIPAYHHNDSLFKQYSIQELGDIYENNPINQKLKITSLTYQLVRDGLVIEEKRLHKLSSNMIDFFTDSIGSLSRLNSKYKIKCNLYLSSEFETINVYVEGERQPALTISYSSCHIEEGMLYKKQSRNDYLLSYFIQLLNMTTSLQN